MVTDGTPMIIVIRVCVIRQLADSWSFHHIQLFRIYIASCFYAHAFR